ncbi:PadR family transcriptional regulator [Selenomonas ruminis]|uniref:PadR family transcriptional regulator n=1 Tax=Selenomonas ruminis TaxID=2593411 RepID=A0A5D6WEY2_9FIRM|nr:PadR family transcriptional regulator [Selenomonas sp. mPRGC5]TYZ24984.1 PadR family transcriptional regulator [Selenomonas sp. mPRGC5]
MAQKNVLKYVVLGLLSHQDLTGYDIKKLFEGELGDFWYSNHSQIYPELKKMVESGLISAYDDTVGQKMTKTYYTIQPQGKAELADWLKEPLNALPPTRDEFSMKLYLLNDVNDPLIKKLFAEEIARHEEKLQYLQSRWKLLFTAKAEQKKHYGHAMILRQAIRREEWRLQWLREEQAKLEE